ncbi:MAG: hypothetical protein KME17_08845 [Cyanosarcina radialis HA8281-LM2]|nr:hypothetical protein [Cyanosarcina radialis HA8281-LM2]
MKKKVFTDSELHQWQVKIAIVDRHNIFCHCCTCSYEWVDSVWDAACNRCGSCDVERISCWQFPDD